MGSWDYYFVSCHSVIHIIVFFFNHFTTVTSSGGTPTTGISYELGLGLGLGL